MHRVGWFAGKPGSNWHPYIPVGAGLAREWAMHDPAARYQPLLEFTQKFTDNDVLTDST